MSENKIRSMNEKTMTKRADEKDRDALATRMREAIYDELTRDDDRAEEEIFSGRGPRHVLLGAIADLAESLICSVAAAGCSVAGAGGGCDWREMVGEVHGEMLKWVQHLEDC
jgi:hypothetical protein